jgi:hypothetical protein
MAIPPNINNVEPIEQDLTLRLPQQLTQHLTKHFMSSHCHRPDCSWLSLDTLKNYTVAPPLRPDSEISGIGVSTTNYLPKLHADQDRLSLGLL